jgi:hypothetical protein
MAHRDAPIPHRAAGFGFDDRGGGAGFVKNFTAAIASPSGPGPVVKPISLANSGNVVRGPPSLKLRTLREVISADRIARSRSDPVFVLQVPAARLGSAGGSRDRWLGAP